MKGALAIALRDLLKFYKQPRLIVTSAGLPFITLLLLGGVLGGAITHSPIAMVQESYGPYSSSLISNLQNELTCQYGGINCQNSFQLLYAPNLPTALQMLHKGSVTAIVDIPMQFDSALAANSKVTVTVTLDNTDPVSAAIVGSEISQTIQGVSPSAQSSAFVQTSTSPGTSNINFDLEDAYRNILYIEFITPGSIIQSIMFVGIIAGGVQLVVDRERGVIEGYLVTPLKTYEILLGVLISGVAKALLTCMSVAVLAVALAHVRPISLFPTPNVIGILLTILTLFLTSLGMIALLTAFAVRAGNADLYRFTIFPINLILYYTSGAIYPLQAMPLWMREVSVINPQTYAVDALRVLMFKGGNLPALGSDFAFLTVFALLMLGLSIAAFRRAL